MFARICILLVIIGMAAAFSPIGQASKRSTSLNMGYAMGINGFGRIGRLVARIMIDDPNSSLLAINTGADAKYMAYQFKYDTIHGRWGGSLEVDGDDMLINNQRVKTTHSRNPEEIPWKALGVEYLCESTGAFLTKEKCQPHINAGVKKIIYSAPAKDDSKTIVMGVNQEEYNPSDVFVSCASCTTNGLAPMVKVINDAYGIDEALMTTVHAMTSTQMVVDGSSKKDWRGGRGASSNIIPSTTGAAKAVAAVIPSLKGKITGMAFRVPTADVSVVDLTCKLNKATTYEDICKEVQRRANGDMKGFIGYTDEALVSQDFVSCPISSVFDSKAGIMLNEKFVKLIAWYDNEWGYSNRVVDLMVYMAKADGAKAI